MNSYTEGPLGPAYYVGVRSNWCARFRRLDAITVVVMATLTIEGVAEALTTHWSGSASELTDWCEENGVGFGWDVYGRHTWSWEGSVFQLSDDSESVVCVEPSLPHSELDRWAISDSPVGLLDRFIEAS